ncbi:hypothetical protein BX600DRAFT_493699 [Xylariales sp. PMI_506]|nr:hypothetical protein BX600DRAFT_493699 [Xylariales sp. PMI_506]
MSRKTFRLPLFPLPSSPPLRTLPTPRERQGSDFGAQHGSDPGPSGGDSLDQRLAFPPLEAADSFSTTTQSLQKRFSQFSFGRRRVSSVNEDTWGPYGLNLLYTPPDPLVDLIFVHGLRGGSVKTWCKGDDLSLFWPQAWLPRDPDLQNARIHSFGYNADWADTKETSLDLQDFGRSLFSEMRTSPALRRGEQTPIILVGHSMGGLVMKRAYLLARKSPESASLAERMRCMFFLATPHRGSESAKLLNNILRASTLLSSRQYITDIFKNSPALQLINDEFREFANRIQLWSFYETLKTRVSATSSVMIVERDSAVLGYPGENFQLLNANHRDVCKYDSPEDPNYVTLRNSLARAIEELLGDVFSRRTEETKAQLGSLESYLQISHNAEDDLAEIESLKTEGTCSWFTDLPSFAQWRESEAEDLKMFWLSGQPGSGKSVAATHVIRTLRKVGADTCFHFFRQGQKAQQTISGLLRQIAYQMAAVHPAIRQKLIDMQDNGILYDRDDERGLWRKIFLNEILMLPLDKPQFWIIDGLDECTDAVKLFSLLAKFDCAFPLRIYISSRRRLDLEKQFIRFDRQLTSHHIEPDENLKDIRTYVEENSASLPVEPEECEELIDKIVQKSRGVFLWAKLAIEELDQAFTDESINEILEQIPEGMVPIYTRILQSMAQNIRELNLTKSILTWVACGTRNLKAPELQAALKLDLNRSVRNVNKTIDGLCGQLLRIDNANTIHVIHTTVQDFLLDPELDSPLAIDRSEAHTRLAIICLQFLVSDEMRPPRNPAMVQSSHAPPSDFADYACTAFSEHMSASGAESNEILSLLERFLRTNVLSWIEYIARHKKSFYFVTRTAKNLRRFLKAREQYCAPLGPSFQFVEQWSMDLMRIVSKFGRPLLKYPTAIYHIVPPLCPTGTAVFKQFGEPLMGIRLHGSANTAWDDCICYIDYKESRSMALAAGDALFAIGMKNGSVNLYHTSTCQHKATLVHGEPAKRLKFSNSGQCLAVAGNKRLSMFSTDGELIWTRAHADMPMSFAFSQSDEMLATISRGSHTSYYQMDTGEPAMGHGRARSGTGLAATARQAVLSADISLDLRMVAVAYRGRPVQLWSTENDVAIGTCWLNRDKHHSTIMSPSEVLFNPNPALEILAVTTQDGHLAIFNPWTQREIVSVAGEAYTMASSPDGRTLATGDMMGTIKLWDFDTLALLYTIRSSDYGVRSLAFSGDGFRLFDLRDTKSKVWEPAVLIRKSVSDEYSVSEPGSQPAPLINRGQDAVEIMALAISEDIGKAFLGREDGTVVLYDMACYEAGEVLYSHRMDVFVTHIAYHPKGLVASADVSSTIQIWNLEKGNKTVEAKTKILEHKMPHTSSICTLLFSPQGDFLLVGDRHSETLFALGTSSPAPHPVSVRAKHPESETPRCQWLTTSTWGQTLLAVSDSSLRLYKLDVASETLSLVRTVELCGPDTESIRTTKQIMVDASQRYVAVELERSTDSSSALLIFHLDCWLQPEQHKQDAKALPLLAISSQQLRSFIGFHKQAVVLLDTDLWVCSVETRGDATSDTDIRQHFFIPHEMVGGSSGLDPQITLSGDVVFPKEGSLAVVGDALTWSL